MEIMVNTTLIKDKKKGRKLVLTPTPVKVWAQNHNIEVINPVSLKKDNADLISKLQALNSQLFLVASYGKLIPREIFEIPQHKTLNIHPSLLPKYRGASPIISQIFNRNHFSLVKNLGIVLTCEISIVIESNNILIFH